MSVMNNIKKIKFAGGMILMTVLFATALYFGGEGEVKDSTQNSSSTPISVVDMSSIESQGGRVEMETISLSAPDLDHKVVFKATMSPEAKSLVLENIKKLQQALKNAGEDFNIWNKLASYYQIAEDFQEAKVVWEFLGKAFPKNYVAFGNLAFLEGYYTKDLEMAEQNFLKAIKNGPDQIYLYTQTAEFYRDVLKDTDKAKAIVRQGIKANPLSAELESLLNSL